MVGQHHLFNGREFEQAPGDGDGQGRLACYSPWGHKELDTTERLNSNNYPNGAKCSRKWEVGVGLSLKQTEGRKEELRGRGRDPDFLHLHARQPCPLTFCTSTSPEQSDMSACFRVGLVRAVLNLDLSLCSLAMTAGYLKPGKNSSMRTVGLNFSSL